MENSEPLWGLGVLTTFGFNGQEQLERAAGPAQVPPREGGLMSPEVRPDLLMSHCCPRASFPGVQLTFLE